MDGIGDPVRRDRCARYSVAMGQQEIQFGGKDLLVDRRDNLHGSSGRSHGGDRDVELPNDHGRLIKTVGLGRKRGQAPKAASGPQGASHFWCLTPFPKLT